VTEISSHAFIIVPTTNGGYVPNPSCLHRLASLSISGASYVPSPSLPFTWLQYFSSHHKFSHQCLLPLIFMLPRLHLLHLRRLNSMLQKSNLERIH
jgi:hypothetical protein